MSGAPLTGTWCIMAQKWRIDLKYRASSAKLNQN
jgi:hypothetical protein